jgi:hypothetical protein
LLLCMSHTWNFSPSPVFCLCKVFTSNLPPSKWCSPDRHNEWSCHLLKHFWSTSFRSLFNSGVTLYDLWSLFPSWMLYSLENRNLDVKSGKISGEPLECYVCSEFPYECWVTWCTVMMQHSQTQLQFFRSFPSNCIS